MALGTGTETVLNLGVASLIGLAVGFEREWSGHASGPHARFAGVRTFFLLGLLGGMSGLALVEGWTAVAAVVLAGGVLLVLAGYVVATRRRGADPDGTTEAAGLVVVGLGLFAGQGDLTLAAGICAVVVLALREKEELHHLVHRIGETELKAAIQFAVLALVVLPLLPAGPYGPLGGIRPRSLWTIVLVFSGLNFLGFLARRIAGPGLGYPITGMLGGVLSSTAVTLQFSRISRRDPDMAGPLALGVVAACTVLLPRVALLSAILNPDVAKALIPYLVPPAIVGVGAVLWTLLRRRWRNADASELKDQNPLNLWSAIQMAILLQLVLMALTFVRENWGSPGIIASGAVVGLTDVDALTYSMNKLGSTPELVALAARAIAVGILANTALKVTMALILGRGGYRWRVALGLIALGVAIGGGLWLVH